MHSIDSDAADAPSFDTRHPLYVVCPGVSPRLSIDRKLCTLPDVCVTPQGTRGYRTTQAGVERTKHSRMPVADVCTSEALKAAVAGVWSSKSHHGAATTYIARLTLLGPRWMISEGIVCVVRSIVLPKQLQTALVAHHRSGD